MIINYPKEIDDLWESIPEKYRNHPENAPKEYQERFELWKKKAREWDDHVMMTLWGYC
jgi:hypothetical protein